MNAESPFSWNSHYSLNGWPCQLTIRADDYEELSRRVNEAVTQLEAKGAVPADMIWAAKPKPAAPQTTSNPYPQTTSNPPATTSVRRPVGRPPKRPDTYDSEDGPRCNHLVNGEVCTSLGEWKDFPDKFRPGQMRALWSCPEFFNHDDYRAKEALKAAQGGTA